MMAIHLQTIIWPIAISPHTHAHSVWSRVHVFSKWKGEYSTSGGELANYLPLEQKGWAWKVNKPDISFPPTSSVGGELTHPHAH